MTEPVSDALVAEVWQEMAVMSASQIPGLIDQMQDEQPVLLAFLLALEGDELPREEFEVILYLGIAVWQMMKRGHPRLMHVSIKKLEQENEENIQTLKFMEQDTTSDFLSATREIFKFISRTCCIGLYRRSVDGDQPRRCGTVHCYHRNCFSAPENYVGCPHPLPAKVIFSLGKG